MLLVRITAGASWDTVTEASASSSIQTRPQFEVERVARVTVKPKSTQVYPDAAIVPVSGCLLGQFKQAKQGAKDAPDGPNSPSLQDELTKAIMDAMSAHQAMST